MSECPWKERMGPGMDMCLLETLKDGEELVFCEEASEEPRKDESSIGPFMVCFDLDTKYCPAAQVFLKRGGTCKIVRTIVGEEALELHRALTLDGSTN